MPAPARYAYVPDQLRELALDARARGLSFEQWWHEALPVRVCKACGGETLMPTCPRIVGETVREDVRTSVECGGRTRGPAPPTFTKPGSAGPRAVLWPTDTVERRAWLAGVDSAREGWRDAYEGRQPTRQHLALAKLAESLRQLGPEGYVASLAVA